MSSLNKWMSDSQKEEIAEQSFSTSPISATLRSFPASSPGGRKIEVKKDRNNLVCM